MLKHAALPLLIALATPTIGSACAQGLQADIPSGGRAAARVDVVVRMMRADEARSRRGDARRWRIIMSSSA
jgi:hypothetical protein